MPPSFLSYIVQQHGLTFEDVATDALAFVLQNSTSARSALRASLGERVTNLLPPFFSVETRHTTEELCKPDVLLRDGSGMPCVIIESKFSAGLTANQPVGYLKFLENKRKGERATLLVFLVPESKVEHYREKVETRCAHMPVFWGKSNDTNLRSFIHVMTWTELLQILKRGEAGKPEFAMFLQDLERMCQVAEPDDFKPMSAEEVSRIAEQNCSLATRTRNFMDLAGEVAKRTFVGTQKEWSKYKNAWGPTWSGTYGSIVGLEAWIGVDASAWSDWGGSPIWLELIGKNKLGQIEAQLLSLQRDIGYFVHANGEQIAIPILLGTGTRDEVLERCCAQMAEIEKLLAEGSYT